MTRSAKEYLQAELKRMRDSALEIVDEAEKANRTLSKSEQTEVEKLTEDAVLLKSRITELEDNEKMRETIDSLSGSVAEPPSQAPTRAKTLEEAFVKSDAYLALQKRGFAGDWSTGPIEVPRELVFGGKAFGDVPGGGVVSIGDTGGLNTSAVFSQADVQTSIHGPAEWRITVADLFGQGTTGKSSIRYLEESTTTSGAATVAEGAEKPPSVLDFQAVDEPVRKIATFLPVTDEILEDVEGFGSYLSGRLSLFVRYEEEDQLLAGNGTPPNISGILDRTISTATSGDVSGDNLFDAVLAGITEVRVAGGLEPDAMVIHPQDSATLKASKDEQGRYLGAGPYSAPGSNPWGLREVVTPRITQGTVLVGAFREGAQLFRRGGITVTMSNSHSDWFRKDLTAIRCESRLALAVYRPLAFCTVTVGS